MKELFRAKPVIELKDFSKDIFTRNLIQFYDMGVYPRRKNFGHMLSEKLNYSGSIRSAGRIFKSLGFKYRKCNDGRNFLLERKDIAAAPNVFLRKMHSLRQN
jgi:hypothetical protein